MQYSKIFIIVIPLILILAILGQFVLANPNSTNATTGTNTSTSNEYIYAIITSSKTGNVTGDVQQNGYKNEIQVLSYSIGITYTTPPVGTGGSGTFTYDSFKITVALGSESPTLIQFLVTGEILPSAIFNFYHYTPLGQFQNYYRIKLINTQIVQYSSFGTQNGNFEVYSFIYQTIVWTNVLTGNQTQANA